jgi:hypothetical protein
MSSIQVLEGLVRALVKQDVHFLLIGALAVSVHGYIRATKDVDIVFEVSRSNAERLAVVLDELGAEVVSADLPTPTEGITPDWLMNGGQFVFATDSGTLDMLAQSSIGTYEDLVPRAESAELSDGTKVPVVAYADLVRSKQLAGRPQDLLDLESLRKVREEGDERDVS